MSTVSSWKDFTPTVRHPNVKSVELRQEVTSYPGTDITTLAPGESVRIERPSESSRWTDDHRVTFANGGVLEEKPGEGGMVLTSPDGQVSEMAGWVDVDEEGVVVNVRNGEDDGEFAQTLGPNGTLVQFSGYDDPMSTEFGLDGSLSEGARREGPILVFGEAQALNPAVPLDWLTV